MDRRRRDRAAGLSRWARFLVCAAAAWAVEAPAETYAILSLVGDRISIVAETQAVGTHLEQGPQQVVALPDSGLDDFAAITAKAAIEKARPGASVVAFRAKDRALYALRDSWLDADAIQVQKLLSIVAEQIEPSPDGRLLLIAPYRNELEMQTDRNYIGSGRVSGLGFYVNSTMRFRDESGQTGNGFLGVFAHFQLVLINIQAKTVEAQRRAVIGATVAAARAKDGTAWNALSATEKISALESLMKREIERLLPAMLDSKK